MGPMPERNSNEIEWRRVLIRFGVRFSTSDSGFDLRRETRQNLAFIRQVLSCGGWAAAMHGRVFTPDTNVVDERKWLGCWEQLHSGAEAGTTGFEGIELELMDTYMAGVVRWLNALGVTTLISCDGHARRPPYVEISRPDVERTIHLIRLASEGQLQYEGVFILLAGSTALPVATEGSRRDSPPRHRWPRRRQLLDLAERLYEQHSS